MRRYDSNDLGGINAKLPCGKGRKADLSLETRVALDVGGTRQMNFGTWLLKILSQFVKDWIDAGEWRPRYE